VAKGKDNTMHRYCQNIIVIFVLLGEVLKKKSKERKLAFHDGSGELTLGLQLRQICSKWTMIWIVGKFESHYT
jgi:hypothetical protein